jgi:hypothetical protein
VAHDRIGRAKTNYTQSGAATVVHQVVGGAPVDLL